MIKIYIGADHRGYRLKNKLVESLRKEDYAVIDVGNSKYDRDDDFVDFAIKVGEKATASNDLGIVICSSGIGVCIASNKVKGVRAGLCTTLKQVRVARDSDNINVLCLTSELVSEVKNLKIALKFINTVFSPEERYLRRLNKIKKYES
jgi:ribose 5-phosphate isomerase B